MRQWTVAPDEAPGLIAREFGVKRVTALRALDEADANGVFSGRRYHVQLLLDRDAYLITSKERGI